MPNKINRTVSFIERKRWESRPVFQGYIIPFTTVIDEDGTPNFQAIDGERVLDCAFNHKCGVCGESFLGDEWIAFIGGEKCAENFTFVDPAMHPECAYYAAETCPYLNNADGKYSQTPNTKASAGTTLLMLVEMDKVRPAKMMILFVKGYELFSNGSTLLLQAKDTPRLIDWEAMPPSPE